MRAALVGLGLLAMVFSGCSDEGGGNDYPESYLLYEGDLPEGTKMAEVDDSMRQMGIDSNPDEIPRAYIMAMLQQGSSGGQPSQGADYVPDVAWIELIKRADDMGGFFVAALFYNDEAKIDAALAQLKGMGNGEFCSYAGSSGGAGRMMRDGPVLVVMGGGDVEMRDFVPSLTSKLLDKAPGLKDICA